jgi:hypothetical protein
VLTGLYEVLKSRGSIQQLEFWYRGHNARQRENTRRRIDEEQNRQDLFMALALEIEEDDPRPSTPPPETKLADLRETNGSTGYPHVAGSIHRIANRALYEDDPTQLAAVLGDYGDLEDESPDDEVRDGENHSLRQCHQTLRELLRLARQKKALLSKLEAPLDSVAADHSRTGLELLDQQLDQAKGTLEDLLPALQVQSLKREGEAADHSEVGAIDHSQGHLTQDPENEDQDNAAAQDIGTSRISTKRSLDHDADEVADATVPVTKRQKLEPDVVDSPSPSVQSPLEPGESSQTVNEIRCGIDSVGLNAKDNVHAPRPCNSVRGAPPSLITKFRIGPGHDPATFTSEKVFNLKGFRYRYARESTLAQRISIVEHLIEYVDECVCPENAYDHQERRGKYHRLYLPNNATRTPIIHGVWDLPDGTRPAGFGAFYNGDDDYVTELRNSLLSETEGEEQRDILPPFPSIPRLKLIFKKPKSGNGADKNSAGDMQRSSVMAKRLDNKSHKPEKSMPIPQTKAAKKPSRAKLSANSASLPSRERSIAARRPRRLTVKKSYHKNETEDEDDDFDPSSDVNMGDDSDD